MKIMDFQKMKIKDWVNFARILRCGTTLSFSQGRYKSVIRKLAEKHPEDCQIIADNEDGSICAHVPVSWLRISPPRQYTEEQRQQMGEQIKRLNDPIKQ